VIFNYKYNSKQFKYKIDSTITAYRVFSIATL